MLDQVNATPTPHKRLPWNKGKLTGAKPPLRPTHVWSIWTTLQIEARSRPNHVQIWRSTASFVVATWRMNGRFAPRAADREHPS
jgi:hypothetical protein